MRQIGLCARSLSTEIVASQLRSEVGMQDKEQTVLWVFAIIGFLAVIQFARGCTGGECVEYDEFGSCAVYYESSPGRPSAVTGVGEFPQTVPLGSGPTR